MRLIGCLVFVVMFGSCVAQKNDTDCVREINKLVQKELKKQSSVMST